MVDFKCGDKVLITRITTTIVGDGEDDIVIGNEGVVVGFNAYEKDYNEVEVSLFCAEESWFVSACDLEIVDE